MTAAGLHRLEEHSSSDDYEGGFSTDDRGAHFRVSNERGGSVDFHIQLSLGKRVGIGSIYKQLRPDEARELAGALERAAGAAENARERTA